MSEKLEVSNAVKQWLINLISRLGKVTRDFEIVYKEAPLELLASFVGRCDGIWRIDLIPFLPYRYDYHYYFKCSGQYFRVIVGYKIDEKIHFEASHNPIASYLLAKVREVRRDERRRLKTTLFKVQLGANLLAYHSYMFPIGKIRGRAYNLCRIVATETLYKYPFIRFSDKCIEDEYTYEVRIYLTNEGLGIGGYENKKDPNLPPTDLLNAFYEKRDEIERRVNPMLAILDEITKGAVSIFLY